VTLVASCTFHMGNSHRPGWLSSTEQVPVLRQGVQRAQAGVRAGTECSRCCWRANGGGAGCTVLQPAQHRRGARGCASVNYLMAQFWGRP
jgi:hypothetical protein